MLGLKLPGSGSGCQENLDPELHFKLAILPFLSYIDVTNSGQT